MKEVRNSELLDRIIEYAQKRTSPDGVSRSVTFESFILSVIELIHGDARIICSENEKIELLHIISDKFKFTTDPGFENLTYALKSHIDRNPDANDYEYAEFNKLIADARKAAQKTGAGTLTPAILLTHLLDHPKPYIAALFAGDGSPVIHESASDGSDDWDSFWIDEPEDPRVFAESLTKKVSEMRDRLSEIVFGQENAIDVFADGYFGSEIKRAADRERVRPAATFLFAGPPGVGKTFLVNTVVSLLDMEDSFKCFDMSEYADSLAFQDLLGYSENFKNPKEGILTSFVKNNPRCVLLFDEIEKAHANTLHLFLQILDEGVLTDSKTLEKVSFKDALIFFTTNAGRNLYDAPDAYDFSGVPRKVILNALLKDVNPVTGKPFFPAAICSRFANGNVVMFNHMSAASLKSIAESVINRKADYYHKKYGFNFNIEQDVFASLLFSEGGCVDARALRGRAGRFFDEEIHELFRFLASEEHEGNILSLENIVFNVELPEDGEILSLFRNSLRHRIIIYSSDDVVNKCRNGCPEAEFIAADGVASAKRKLMKGGADFAVIDLLYKTPGEKRFINIEDVDSAARDLFWYLREKHADMPIYILQRADRKLSNEERRSYLRVGVRGFITYDGKNGFADDIGRVCGELYQQSRLNELAVSNKLITFETGQRVGSDGKSAEITLFDFALEAAVDAEDKMDVMSGVSRPKEKFSDVIGAENAKAELSFFIDYLKDPKRFAESGLKAPRGVLLYGPPGTGKTMLAKAVANEAGVTFIASEGNRFLKSHVGEGKDKLHELFSVARKYSPSIIFIDELEAIAQERKGGSQPWANGEDVLTALLTEMDGFNTDITRPVFVLAATNFDVEPGGERSLDPALLRRFDSRICIDLPNKKDRIKFIKKKCSDNRAFTISEEKIENVAVRSTGMSFSDLDSVMELSLRTAVRNNKKTVTDEELDEAFESFFGGEAKLWDASQLERVAIHEAGHAFLCWQCGETPAYVSVIGRDGFAGYMQSEHDETKAVRTKDELLARIRTFLGGRAAEIVFYGERDGLSTGAAGDLAGATETARNIVCAYGMSDQFGLAAIGREAAEKGELSGKVLEAVNAILDQEMKNAIRLIQKNRPAVEALVAELTAENHLGKERITKVFEEIFKKKTV